MKDINMLIKTKIVINLNHTAFPVTESWLELNEAKVAEMVVANKTDGKLIPARVPSRFYRFFIDSASAQEYIDWVKSSDVPEVATFELVEL